MNVISRHKFAASGFRMVRFAAVGLSLLVARSANAGLIQTVEGPGAQTSSAKDTSVIDFNNLPTGDQSSLALDVSSSLTAKIEGKFSINPADQYGGAIDPSNKDQSSNYFAVKEGDVTLKLSNAQAYFGLWISAADKFNQIAFFNGDKQVGSLTGTGEFLSALPKEYLGNPTPDFQGKNTEENYAFVNFYAQTKEDEFDTIVLTNLPGWTVFESDNFTFSTELQAPPSGRGNRASKLWIDCCLNRRFGKSQFVGTSKIRVSSNGVRCVHVIY